MSANAGDGFGREEEMLLLAVAMLTILLSIHLEEVEEVWRIIKALETLPVLFVEIRLLAYIVDAEDWAFVSVHTVVFESLEDIQPPTRLQRQIEICFACPFVWNVHL